MRLSFFQVLLLSVAVNAFTPAESTKRPQNFAVQASAEDDLEKTRRVIAQFHDKGPSKKRTSLVSSPHISSQPPTTTDTTTQTSKLRKLTMWRPLGRSLQLRTKLSNLNQKVSRSLQKAPFIRQGSSSTLSDDQAFLFQSLIKDRRTGTSLVYTLNDREKEQELIKAAIHRAVECAHFAPNHKRTEPTSFVQIMSDSSAARELGEIVYQVSARTKSVPVGEKKKEKWSQIPAYLVAIVHENQSALKIDETAKFDALPYAPPETERQLEDYASASSAIQNILLSLHADGITSKWATGPVIATPAFRELVKAKPTDRIAALIMVGGVDSTKFSSHKEEQVTNARRQRRRGIDGDLLQNLS